MIQLSECCTTKGFLVTEEKASPLSSWKSLKIQGVFSRADALNQNGRIYPRAVLQRAIAELSECLSARRVQGELGHPADGSPVVDLRNVSHVITELKFQGNDVIGTAIVFDDPGPSGTPNGRILGALIRQGCTVGISSRGMGSVTEDYNSNLIVNDLKLVTWDAVQDPSTHGAFLNRLEESRKMTIEQALTEKNFYDSFKEDIRGMISRNSK